jgi:MFS transporter, MCT family, solute carrier family 16 (monocarboxylic acid transporters), member 10
MSGLKDDRGLAVAPMMLLRGFFAQNVATGCSFGGFAVSILALEERFQTSRALAEMVLAIVVLTMSLLAPVAGAMIVRLGLRATMTIGVAMSAVGYAALAISPSMPATLAITAILIGPGAALFGSIPASMLASEWYPAARGKALGIVNMPLFVALVPLLGIAVIEAFGLNAFYLCLAGIHLLLVPLMLSIEEPPRQRDAAGEGAAAAPVVAHPLTYLLAQSTFWLIVLSDGVLYGSNITNSAHIVPIAVEGGISPAAGAILLSVGGGASILGSIFSGFLADRIGPVRTLAFAAFGSAASWAILASTSWYPGLTTAMLLCGACGAAVFPATNVLITQVFGIRALPQALGLLSALTLPLTFAMSPTAGAVHDILGEYATISTSLAAACAVVGLLFVVMRRRVERAAPNARFAGEQAGG